MCSEVASVDARVAGTFSGCGAAKKKWVSVGLVSHSSDLQRRVALGIRIAGRATIRSAAVLGLHGDDRCRRGSCAPGHAFRGIAADDRRIGFDFRSHGRGDALSVPARRSTRTVAGSRRGLSGACSAADIKLARPARARLPAGMVRRQLAVRARLDQHGWGRAGDCMAGGISVGSLPVSWHSPHSIPFQSRRAPARMKAWTRRPQRLRSTRNATALNAAPRALRRRCSW
jgi:hypothetical protein